MLSFYKQTDFRNSPLSTVVSRRRRLVSSRSGCHLEFPWKSIIESEYIAAEKKDKRCSLICEVKISKPHNMFGLQTRKRSLFALVDHVSTVRLSFCTEAVVLKPISASIRVNQSNIDNIKKVCCRKGRSCSF